LGFCGCRGSHAGVDRAGWSAGFARLCDTLTDGEETVRGVWVRRAVVVSTAWYPIGADRGWQFLYR
jgi:hypothetical protein